MGKAGKKHKIEGEREKRLKLEHKRMNWNNKAICISKLPSTCVRGVVLTISNGR